MHASVGDRIVIKGHRHEEPQRDGEVLAVRGANGGPPYLVRWDDSGHVSLFFPGSDATAARRSFILTPVTQTNTVSPS